MMKLRKIEPLETAELAFFVNSVYRGEEAQKTWTSEASFIAGQRTDPVMLKEILLKPGNTILRNAEGPLACAIHLAMVKNEAWLGMITVKLDLQGSGIGRSLLQAAESYAEDILGATMAKMHVISIRAELIAWYQRRGYAITNVESPFPYGDSRYGVPLKNDLMFIVMSKNLKSTADPI